MGLQLDATPEELQVFLAETEELLQGLDEHLVRLEQTGASPDLLQEIFRAAHTIKGSSAAIGHERMARLTHAMETLLDRLRNGELEPAGGLVDLLLETLDALRVLADEVQRGEATDLDIGQLVASLEAWGQAAPGQPSRPVVRPTSSDQPTEATHHIVLAFEPGPWASVRALQVLIALEEVADVLATNPTRAAIERQEVHERMEAWLRCDAGVEEVRRALQDVPEVTVLRLQDAEEVQAALGFDAAAGDRTVGPPESAEGRKTAESRGGNVRGAAATVRVDVERLDNLLNLVGELVIDRTRLVELGRALREQLGEHRLLSELTETTLHLGRVTDELQAEVMKSRMLPIATIFSRFPRVVRDIATRQGKRVDLVIEGQDTEVDRTVIEVIGDPLVHLLRNAIDHGVERPEERAAAGKSAMARVRLSAEHIENSIVIVVEDDGRGIDPARIRARAVERGLLSQEAAARLSDGEVLELIFAPGFSTAEQVSDISGRGVGMDIVRTNVERLGGSVEVFSTLGQGTRFVLRLPLTLAILQALLVQVAGGVYAIPLNAVTETLRVPRRQVQTIRGQEAILLRGRVLPVVRLATVFGWERAEHGRPNLLIVAAHVGERQLGLVVDALLGEQEVVIKALGPVIGEVPGISSAAILGDGTVALIVDVPGLLQLVARNRNEWRRSREHEASHERLGLVRSA